MKSALFAFTILCSLYLAAEAASKLYISEFKTGVSKKDEFLLKIREPNPYEASSETYLLCNEKNQEFKYTKTLKKAASFPASLSEIEKYDREHLKRIDESISVLVRNGTPITTNFEYFCNIGKMSVKIEYSPTKTLYYVDNAPFLKKGYTGCTSEDFNYPTSGRGGEFAMTLWRGNLFLGYILTDEKLEINGETITWIELYPRRKVIKNVDEIGARIHRSKGMIGLAFVPRLCDSTFIKNCNTYLEPKPPIACRDLRQ